MAFCNLVCSVINHTDYFSPEDVRVDDMNEVYADCSFLDPFFILFFGYAAEAYLVGSPRIFAQRIAESRRNPPRDDPDVWAQAYASSFVNNIFLNTSHGPSFIARVYDPWYSVHLAPIIFKLGLWFAEKKHRSMFVTNWARRYAHAYFHSSFDDALRYFDRE